MLENVTALATEIIEKIVWFVSEPYADSILIVLLILTTALVGLGAKMVHKRSDFYNRFQEVYNELLIPNKVKLEYNEKKLKYTQEDHQEWKGFIDEVKKHKWWKYNARGSYKKTEKKFKAFEDSSKTFRLEIISLFQNMIEKNNCEFLILDGNGDPPSEDYIEKEQIPKIFEHVIGGIGIDTYKSGDDRYAFSPPNKIGKADSEEKMKKLGELIQSTINNDEPIKKLLSKRNNEKSTAGELLETYNNKLVKIIHDLRFCRW